MTIWDIIAVCYKSHINSAGVFLSPVAAFLVWFFIAELNFADRDEYRKGHGREAIHDPSPAEIKKLEMRIWFSRVGLILILIGGLLQIISNYLGCQTGLTKPSSQPLHGANSFLMPCWYLVVALLWSGYQAYRGFFLQKRIGHPGITGKEKVSLLCVADMVTFFVCTFFGFLALLAFYRLAWPANPVASSESSNVLLIFLLLFGLAGVTGKLPELLKLHH